MRSLQRWIETAFETFLFNSRLIVILAVLGSLTSSVLMFVRGAIVIWHTAKDFVRHFGDEHGQGEELSIALISSVDSFLFATVLLIFAMGIYELFISKIDPASRTEESRPNWLQIHSLDDLKSAVGKVILMILIVRLFESAVKMKYDSPLHLLYLGLSVLFVAGALFLQHASHKNDKKHDEHPKYRSERHDEEPKQPSIAPAHAPAHAHVSVPAPALALYSQAPSQGHLQPMPAVHPNYTHVEPQQPYPTMQPPATTPPAPMPNAVSVSQWPAAQHMPHPHRDPYAAPRSY